MEIAVIGVNHNIAPIEIRERVSFTESKKTEACAALREKGVDEIVVLSTCNRSEIYFTAKSLDQAIPSVCEYLSKFAGRNSILEYLTVKKNIEAVSYLFKVTAGLESLVIGEDQILGQVKDAFEFALENSYTKKTLNKLFREAITKAKYIKKTFKISENPTSVSYAGLKMLKREIDSLEGKKALIIGAGNMGALSLRYVVDENLSTVYITNRSHDKLNILLNNFDGVEPISYEDRYEYLKEVDILITTTASPHTIFRKERMPKLDKKLFILDLALPRDVDKLIGEMECVQLYDIDDLKKVIDENMEYRKNLTEPIMKLIDEEVTQFYKWKDTTKLDPTIEHLYFRCEEIKNDTLDYIYRKTDITIKDMEIVEKMVNSALKKSIKPIINLKQMDDHTKLEEYITVVNEIFGM